MEAAVELVAERGYDGFTFSDVGERAGYSYGLVPHYFGKKEVLLAEAAENVIHNFSHYDVALNSEEQGLRRIKAIVSVYIDSCEVEAKKTKALHVLLGAALTRESLHARLQQLTQETVAKIESEIVGGQRKGNISSGVDPHASAIILAGMLRGCVNLVLIDDTVDLRASKPEVMRWIDASLGAEHLGEGLARQTAGRGDKQ